MQIDTAWRLLFGGMERDPQGLSARVRGIIADAIETGLLAPDMRVPSSRSLAEALGISRNTVNAAYQHLIDDGLLVARERSGCFVAATEGRTAVEEGPDDWAARFAIRPSRMPQITKPRNWTDYPYPFLFGQFDPGLFPTNPWRESVKAASSVQEITRWARDMIDDDDPDLLDQLCHKVLPRRGIFAGPGEIIITIGSQHALSMLVQLLVGRDTPVGIENPGYPDVRHMVGMATADMRALTCDTYGVVPDGVFASRRVAFVTVGHQCPTTAVMPVGRRRELLDAASRHGVVLVEDDYESDLSVEGDADLPCLKSLDRANRVIYTGSFSKVLAPGLRIGYVVAPKPVVDELRVLRRLMLRHPPTNNQRSLATFIQLGHYRQHLRRTATVLQERAERIAELLPELLPGCRFRRDFGAKSFWIEGPPGLDSRDLVRAARDLGVLIEAGDIFFVDPAESRDLVRAARDLGVLIEAGDIFFVDPAEGRRHFRLGFTSIATHRIEPGLRRLGSLLRSGPA
ncbi:aminotransferase-like domain-containing protein [Azospirillum canadense]|uniref:aminotransferase-like domain-containing protein n=1 Tax=Azospirillum canadense TaxID=403962 RepID=UPI0022272B00|nr:PLP-dependent aminotransferase family protein [Azospirillum canadense]MCW2242147.1 GntR family transcriptional regulator/MocR family aminotransferase [Azospirillum canadense]